MAAIYLSFIKGHWGAQTLGEGGSRRPGTVALASSVHCPPALTALQGAEEG